ncbi:MAG: toprim domain-containing protein [Planctomycetaceae bacterium]|nr:toprim domain-containing protein [Planctomycetaceae bacterium]
MADYLRSHGVVLYRHGEIKDKHVRRGWYSMHCPICEPPFHGSHLWLGLREDANVFYCWNHGRCRLTELFRAWGFSDSPNEFYQWRPAIIQPVSIEEQNSRESIKEYKTPFEPLKLLDSPYHCQYIIQRRLDPVRLQERFQVGALNHLTPFPYKWRLFFPIADKDGVLSTWQTRTIDSRNPYRYLAAKPEQERIPIKNILYGEQYVDYYDSICICEGVFDMLRLDSIGIKSIATFGKSLTKQQLEKLIPYNRRYICFDNERKTQEYTREICRTLAMYNGTCTNIEVESANDWSDADNDELQQLAAEVM